MEKISIIISIFNIKLQQFNNLKKSLLDQSFGFENIEIIFVVNDSNLNYSKKFIKTFESEFKNVKCVFSEKNCNQIISFVNGLKYVTTNYVMFYNCHELLFDNACELLYDEISNNNLDMVVGNYLNVDGGLLINENMDLSDLISNLTLSSRMYNVDFIKNINFIGCNSLMQFNYLIFSQSPKLEFLQLPILHFTKQFENINIINFKKLDVLQKIVNKQYSELTIAIKTPNPTAEKHWGDYFFALSLKKSFQRIGFNVLIHEREFWNDDDDVDIVLVLRGLIEYDPKPQHLNLMWNISHPNDICLDEYEKYDFVFIASNKYAKQIDDKIDTTVVPLLQCTDPEIFFNSQNESYSEDILFVGITRGVFRQIIKDISQTEHDFSVYGLGWEKYLDERFIKGSFIPNNILNQAYSSCKILLNDHWEDMLTKDFPSNRLFDALACGTFVISDDIGSAKEIFEGSVITYDSIDDLDSKISYFLKNDYEREYWAKKGQKLVLERHTFDNRAEEILDVLQDYNFNDFVCNIKPSVDSIDESEEQTNLRIIIIDYNDSKLLSNSINSIKSISSDIPISIINLLNFSQNRFVINNQASDFILDSLNTIINYATEDFILIIESGDLVRKELIETLDEINVKDYENIGAIILDDYYISSNESNFKLGFSPDLYLEYDYVHYSTILNRKVLMDIPSEKQFLYNFIRNNIFELYHKCYKIIKKDIVGIEIKNKLKLSSSNENIDFVNKFLIGKNYSLNNYDDGSIFPIYNPNNYKASIIIPFKDQVHLTKQCVNSILTKTNYENFELILVDNNSYEIETFEYLSEIAKNEKCKIIKYENEFNWSKINNFASTKASGDVLIFLNNDTEVISEDWLSLLIGDAIQPGVAAVGAKLFYPDNTIQHAGVVVGLTYLAGHIFAKESDKDIPKVYNSHRRNVSAVTGACVAFKKETFEEIGRFDEDFEISFSDIEICLRAMELGYRNVFNPCSVLYHHEMKSRGTGDFREIDRLIAYSIFEPYLKHGDPFFNKNFSLNYYDLRIKPKNEIPNYEIFWKKFCNQRDAHLKSIINARKSVDIKEGNDIFRNDIKKSEIIDNLILMKKYLKNPIKNFNIVLWFLTVDDIKFESIGDILRLAELLSQYKSVNNYFIFDSNKVQNVFEKTIKEYKNLNVTLISFNEFNKQNLKVDIAFCVDWRSAYDLARFNDCKGKFYLLMPQNMLNNINLKKKLIEQSFNFKFIGLTNSKKLLSEYNQFNNIVKYFNPFINQDIFFPFPNEKSKKMTIVFYISNNDDLDCFNLEMEVLKIIRAYFGHKVNLIVVGTENNLNEYVSDVINLGIIESDVELANVYRRADICLLLSFDQLVPNIALKCMACGCAIITNKNNNNMWLLKQKENSILTEPNLDCIVEDLINLINDFKLRDRIIRNGLKTVEKFNTENEFLEILNFIKNPLE